jgi:hypothetical protein
MFHLCVCCHIDKQEAKAHANDISTYCGRLLEETEDEVNILVTILLSDSYKVKTKLRLCDE